MKITVYGDIAAQILNGVEPWKSAEVDVPVSEFPPETRELLTSQWRPTLSGTPTPDAVVAAFVEKATRLHEERERARQEADEKITAALTPRTEVHRQNVCGIEVEWVEAELPYIYEGTLEAATPELAAQYRQLREKLQAANTAARDAAYAARAEAIQAARAAEAAEAQRRWKEHQTAQAQKHAETLARRAQTQAVEIEITRGSPREWGEPWGAVVKGRTYDFGAGSYDPANECLTIKCRPGDVIAWGQKCFRKPRKTVHQRARVEDNWELTCLD